MPSADALLTKVLEQIVRPHLVGEIDHDCAAYIARELDEWRQRLRDETACGSCGGTGVCAVCNGLGCVTCDQPAEGEAVGQCRKCHGSGEKSDE